MKLAILIAVIFLLFGLVASVGKGLLTRKEALRVNPWHKSNITWFYNAAPGSGRDGH